MKYSIITCVCDVWCTHTHALICIGKYAEECAQNLCYDDFFVMALSMSWMVFAVAHSIEHGHTHTHTHIHSPHSHTSSVGYVFGDNDGNQRLFMVVVVVLVLGERIHSHPFIYVILLHVEMTKWEKSSERVAAFFFLLLSPVSLSISRSLFICSHSVSK